MTVSDVVQKLRDRIRIKHLAWSTERSYVNWVARYARFARTLPGGLSHEQKFEAFITHLAHQDVSASTQNQAFNALVFLYKDVQEVLGHAHLDTTMGYIHAEPLRVRSPIEAVHAG